MTERSDLSLRNLLHRTLFETLCKITKFLLTFYPHKSIIIAVGKTTAYVPVAQPDRVFGYEPKGQGFESLQARHGNRSDLMLGGFFFCVLGRRPCSRLLFC